MPEPDYHPEDPTVHIWKRLVGINREPSGPQDAEARLKKSKASKAYYEENAPNSRLSGPTGVPKPVYGKCSECGKDIHDERLAAIGMGRDCLKAAVETGRVVVENGQYVLRRRKKRK